MTPIKMTLKEVHDNALREMPLSCAVRVVAVRHCLMRRMEITDRQIVAGS